MKIPRDLTGDGLIKLLSKYNYKVTRQSGSHIRLTTQLNGEHHITIPNHSPIKIGTLSAIINEIAIHFRKTKDELMHELFG
jgi:predicted RNA binding protein YcfA (HicA-like mRNA interferase family)